ncbi:hypothetical protein T01_6925 [Trichinella spiralis]|uniref:Uncharacterized protein n=1 Tax=Trichinella spiralis TaxID=6334 RepID=A0A0V1BJX6_TRISP|nr:hypothetical protein T01_6925 [Trichinella spiralis]
MPRCNLTIGVLDIGRIRLRHQLSFYGVPFALGNVIQSAVTFPSCSSVVSLIIKQISLSQSSSVRTNPDNVLLLVPLCGLPHPMKLVPFATRVRMDVKAFPSRLSVPLLITSSVSFINSWKMPVLHGLNLNIYLNMNMNMNT